MVEVEGTDMMRLLLSVGVSAFPCASHYNEVGIWKYMPISVCSLCFLPLKAFCIQSLWSSKTACLFFQRWWSVLHHSPPISIGNVRTVFSCPVCLKNGTVSILCSGTRGHVGRVHQRTSVLLSLKCNRFLLMSHCEHGQNPFGIWFGSLVSS